LGKKKKIGEKGPEGGTCKHRKGKQRGWREENNSYERHDMLSAWAKKERTRVQNQGPRCKRDQYKGEPFLPPKSFAQGGGTAEFRGKKKRKGRNG